MKVKSFLLLLSLMSFDSSAKTFRHIVEHGHWNNPMDYALSNVDDGDLIIIRSGEYIVNPTKITKNITIIGEGNVVLVSSAKNTGKKKEAMFTFSNNKIRLENVTIRQGKVINSNFKSENKSKLRVGTIEAIKSDLKIRNVKFIGEGSYSGYGVYAKGANIKIKNSTISNFMRNVQGIENSQIEIENSTLELVNENSQSNQTMNLNTFDDTETIISNSKVIKQHSENTESIYIQNSSKLTLLNSDVSGNALARKEESSNSRCIRSSENGTLVIRDSVISSCYIGINPTGSSRAYVTNTTVKDIPNKKWGILAKDNSHISFKKGSILAGEDTETFGFVISDKAAADLEDNFVSVGKTAYHIQSTGEAKVRGGMVFGSDWLYYDEHDSIMDSYATNSIYFVKKGKFISKKNYKKAIDIGCSSCVEGLLYRDTYFYQGPISDEEGSLIHYALRNGTRDMVEVLLKNRIDLSVEDSRGISGEELLLESDDSFIYEELIEEYY